MILDYFLPSDSFLLVAVLVAVGFLCGRLFSSGCLATGLVAVVGGSSVAVAAIRSITDSL
jgi:hypothetical protein